MIRFVVATAGLTGVYALALASADPWDLGIGALLAACVLLVFGRYILQGESLPVAVMASRAVRFPRLAVATFANIVRGTVQVSRAVLGVSSPRNAGFMHIPQGDRTDSGVVISGLLDTLSPGTVLIDIDPVHRTWTIHALEAGDEAALRAEIARFYTRFQRPVWP